VARLTRNPSSKQKRKKREKNPQVAEGPTVGCSPEMTDNCDKNIGQGLFNVSKIVPDHSKRNEKERPYLCFESHQSGEDFINIFID